MTVDAGNIEYSVGINTTEMEKSAKKVESGVNKINAQMTKVAESTKKANSALGRMGRNAGQAGIQVQQFVGQIQGGQDAMLAFGAQAADLGIVLGLPLVGAVAGLGAAVVGTLIPSLSAANEEVKEILPSIDDLIEKMETLTLAQKDYVKSEIAKTISQENKELQEKNNRIESLIKSNRYLLRDEEKNAEQIDKQTDQLRKLRAERDQLVESIDKQRQVISDLNKAESNNASNSVTTENSMLERIRTLAEINKALDAQVATLGMSEREMALYSVSLLAVGDTEKSIVDALKQKINAHYDEIDAIKAKEEEQKKIEKSQREEERRLSSLANRGATIGLTDEETFRLQLENQDAILKEMLDARLITEQEYIERRNNLYAEGNNELGGLWESIENQAVGTFAAVAVGAKDGRDAIMQLTASIATQLVGALIKMGIQAAIGQASAIASGTATAAALSNAYATPAALASLASYGANAIPAQAGIATTVATTNALALGGREMGGPVSAGSMYRVGERGPEIFTAGGKNFMIPGESGQVVNNKNSFGSAPQQSQNVSMVFNVAGDMSEQIKNEILNNQELVYAAVSAVKAQNGEVF